jgi:hypothetical protein
VFDPFSSLSSISSRKQCRSIVESAPDGCKEPIGSSR